MKQKNQLKNFYPFLSHNVKMEQKVLILGKNVVNKNFFHKHKHLIDTDKVDVDRIVISNKDSYGKKDLFSYFIGYVTNCIKSLCIKLPQMNGYVKYFSDSKCRNLLVHNKELLKNMEYEMWNMKYGIRLVIY